MTSNLNRRSRKSAQAAPTENAPTDVSQTSNINAPAVIMASAARSTRSRARTAADPPCTTDNPPANGTKTRRKNRTKAEIEAEKIETARKRETKILERQKKAEAIAAAKEATAQKKKAAEITKQEKASLLKAMEAMMEANAHRESFSNLSKAKKNNKVARKVAAALMLEDDDSDSEAEETLNMDEDSAEESDGKMVSITEGLQSLDDRMIIDENNHGDTSTKNQESDLSSGDESVDIPTAVHKKSPNAGSVTSAASHAKVQDDSDVIMMPAYVRRQKITLTMPSSDDLNIERADGNGGTRNADMERKTHTSNSAFITSDESNLPAPPPDSPVQRIHTLDITDGFIKMNSTNVKERVDARRISSKSNQDDNLLKVPEKSSASSIVNWKQKLFKGIPLTAVKTDSRGRSVSPSSAATDWTPEPESSAPSRAASLAPVPESSLIKQPTSSGRLTKATSVKVVLKEEDTEELRASDTAASRSRTKKSTANAPKAPVKRFTYEDIPVDKRAFRRYVLPAYFAFMMSLENPFDIHDERACPALQKIFNAVFTEKRHEVTEDGPIKSVCDQRFIEWRGKIAEYANRIIKEHFEKPEIAMKGEQYRIKYVLDALSCKANGNPDIVWKNFFDDKFQKASI